MKEKENDPDILQILDELDEEWVTKWKKAAYQYTSQPNSVTLLVRPLEEKQLSNLRNKDHV